MSITILDVEQAFKKTEKKATPHRQPDFNKVRAAVGGGAEVKGHMWFVEEHNTGYNGYLERWEFRALGPNGNRISFWADLLPGIIVRERAS